MLWYELITLESVSAVFHNENEIHRFLRTEIISWRSSVK